MKALEADYDDLREGDPQGRLFNDDLAPARASDRQWNSYALFSLWMNDAHNASNYTFAAGLFIGTGAIMGMTPLSIVIGVFIATFIIFIACCISGLMGYETGAPYPVISRVTWGVWGANFPALVRGIVVVRDPDVSGIYLTGIAVDADLPFHAALDRFLCRTTPVRVGGLPSPVGDPANHRLARHGGGTSLPGCCRTDHLGHHDRPGSLDALPGRLGLQVDSQRG